MLHLRALRVRGDQLKLVHHPFGRELVQAKVGRSHGGQGGAVTEDPPAKGRPAEDQRRYQGP